MNEQAIDHEVRIRMLEAAIDRNTDAIIQIKNDINTNSKEIKLEMKSNFHWTMGIIFGFISVVILPILCSEVISMIKTISH